MGPARNTPPKRNAPVRANSQLPIWAQMWSKGQSSGGLVRMTGAL